jgi:hypothetical protein
VINDVSAGRSALGALRALLRLDPVGGNNWTTARLGLGPWAARISLDAERGVMRCESQVYGVMDTSGLEEALAGFPFGSPEVRYDLTPGPSVLTVSYEKPLRGLDPRSARDACLLLGIATATVAHGLWECLSPLELARLRSLGITSKEQLFSTAHQLLQASPVAHLEWDGAAAPIDAAAPASPASLPAGVAGVIPGPLRSEWDGPVREIREVVDAFTSTMLVEVQRHSRNDEIYIQVQRDGRSLFAEAVSNTFLEGASRLSGRDVRSLARLGWAGPRGQDLPNFHRTYGSDDTTAAARHIAQTFRDAYHVDPEADGWLVSYAETPAAPKKPQQTARAVALKCRVPAIEPPTPEITEPQPQQVYIDWLGAEVVGNPVNGTQRFKSGDLTGSVQLLGSKSVRAWVLLAENVNAEKATNWITHNKQVGNAWLEMGGTEEATAIFLLCKAQTDQLGPPDYSFIRIATALKAAWRTHGRGLLRILRRLSTTGISVPPLGSVSEREIDTYGEWHWGSRYVDPFDLYMFDVQRVAKLLLGHGHVFALAHQGHGINSYGLNLVTSAGPIAAFVQHGWGGVYTDPVSSVTAIDSTYARLHVLMREAVKHEDCALRWLLLFSGFRGVCAILDLRDLQFTTSWEERLEAYDSESALFSAVASKIAGASYGMANKDVAW